MIFPEFAKYSLIEDKENPFSNLYQLDSGETFYVEPVFYTQLQGFKEQFTSDYPRILSKMEEVVRKNKKVIFTGCFDYPQTVKDGYIILEITDITDPLLIFAEDKSRGSDYGD